MSCERWRRIVIGNGILAGLLHGTLRSVAHPMVDGITIVLVVPHDDAVELVLFSESFSPVDFEELNEIPEITSFMFASPRYGG